MVSITSKLSAKCLDITDGVEQNGAPLQVWTCDAGHPDFKQRWLLRGNEVVHEARSGGPDFCVDIPNNDQTDGSRLQIWQCLGTPQQQWQRTADSRLRIGGQCMDLTDGDFGDGVPVQIWECDGPTPQNQEWVFTPVDSEDMSTIVI